jgi:hypothetical protein
MNWLTPLCQEILKLKSFSREHRDAAILWAAELSGICRSHAKDAPSPIVQPVSDPTSDCWIELAWLRQRTATALSVVVEQDLSAALHLHDTSRSHIILKPSHEQLKRAVQAFFQDNRSKTQ